MSQRILLRIVLAMVGVTCCQAVRAGEPTEFPAQARQSYEQGRDLQKKGKLNEAITAFEEAIKYGMDAFPRVHLQRASSNLDLKKYDTAIAQYTKFIEKFGLEESCRA
jgi:outer membrane protein assembly factor BamD (BamD/ComL family)